jgi:hypothetical protein
LIVGGMYFQICQLYDIFCALLTFLSIAIIGRW